MKTAIEEVEGLHCKLRMMCILIDEPTTVFCDNELVFKSATRSEATLKKKHNTIAHHRTREAVAAGIVRMAWEDYVRHTSTFLSSPDMKPYVFVESEEH